MKVIMTLNSYCGTLPLKSPGECLSLDDGWELMGIYEMPMGTWAKVGSWTTTIGYWMALRPHFLAPHHSYPL